MKSPRLSGDALLEDIAGAGERDESFHLWWLGQSGFLIRCREHHLLMDPYLSDSLTRKYANTDRPHVRITERVIEPARLNFVDVVTSSHNHTDHLDGETLRPLIAACPGVAIIVPEANRKFAADRLQVEAERLTGARVGTPVRAAGFEIHPVPAAHEELEVDGEGLHRFLGHVVCFEGRSVYHSGDTVLYDGMVETLRAWKIDVALLPINGRAPERRVAGNLSGNEAAKLARDIGAELAIPCHYDMFEFNTASPEEFVRECERLGQAFRVLENGERHSVA